MTRIVIIGGGAAGINMTQALAKDITEADLTEHATKFVRIVRGVATQIDTNEVSYHAIGSDDKESSVTEKLQFNYLVLATGSTYSVPIKQDSRDYDRSATEEKLQGVRGHIEKAEKIVVVGGGAVGCEVAAEIKAKYHDKSVTIVDANQKLISDDNLREKFYVKLSESLEKLGVKVILGERLTERLSGNEFEPRTLHTDKGTEIESDIQLLCGGFSPMASLVQEMDSSLVTDRGAVKVNGQLHLEGDKYTHIFALGDVCNHPAPKRSLVAGEEGKFLAGELFAVIRKTQPGFTNEFEVPTTDMTVLPLGRRGGVSQLPLFGGVVFGDWITWLIKSRDYFAGQIWSSLCATIPNDST